MSTCGGCRHYGNNSCYSTSAALSLLDDVSVNTPACKHFEQTQTLPAIQPPMRHECSKEDVPLSMLSAETLSKLMTSDPAVQKARAIVAQIDADLQARNERRRDWHRDIDR